MEEFIVFFIAILAIAVIYVIITQAWWLILLIIIARVIYSWYKRKLEQEEKEERENEIRTAQYRRDRVAVLRGEIVDSQRKMRELQGRIEELGKEQNKYQADKDQALQFLAIFRSMGLELNSQSMHLLADMEKPIKQKQDEKEKVQKNRKRLEKEIASKETLVENLSE